MLFAGAVPFAFLPGMDGLEAYSLYMKSRAFVSGKVVRLKDIARISGEETPGLISDKIVTRGANQPFYIRAQDLKKTLRNGPEKLDWVYGSGAWIIPTRGRYTKAELKSELQKQIRALPGGAVFLKDSVITIGKLRRYPPRVQGAVQVSFQLPRDAGRLYPGRRAMSLVFSVVNEQGRKIALLREQIPMLIQKRTRIYTARRNMRVGDRLQKGDYEIKEELLSESPERYVRADPAGLKVLGYIRAGEPIRRARLRLVLPVRRGQGVDMVYQAPGIVIKARAVAERSGKIGDVIPVRALFPSGRASRRVRGKIVAEGIVMLEK